MATVKELIDRYVKEMSLPGSRPIGLSQMYTLRLLHRSPIGSKEASQLRASDFIEHCRARKALGINPATINQDATYLRGVLKYASTAWEMDDVTLTSFERARPILIKQQLIAKSRPRTRRPTPDEINRLLALAAADDCRPKNKIPMVPIIQFSLLSARRISETCRIRWDDIDHEKKTCLVRDLKSPKGKGENGEFPLLGNAYAIVMAQPRKDGEERIFPYNAKSIEARYIKMKHHLGIKDLRLHDNRREAISALFERGFNVPEVAQLSLHKAHSLLLRVYTALKPEDLHKGPASKRPENVHVGITGDHRKTVSPS